MNKAVRALGLSSFLVVCVAARAATFYVDPVRGDDAAAGTSAEHPWRTLDQAGRAPLQPGDRLALAGGARHLGQLLYNGLAGSESAPITLGRYTPAGGDAAGPAVIDGRGRSAALELRNCRYVVVENLLLTADGGSGAAAKAKDAMRCGVLVEADRAGEFPGITLQNLHVRAVSFEEPGHARPPEDVKTANGTARYGWGIRFIVRSADAVMRDVSVKDCVIERVDHTGLKFTAPAAGIRGVRVEGVRVSDVGGPGVQMSGVAGGHFTRLDVSHSGSASDSRHWGRGSGLWTWGTRDVVIEHSPFTHANGPGDSAGVHIDYDCRNVVVQYNFSAHNAGGFCEILGNNRNCAYRYNISVDDGQRVKGRDGAFQEGKTFWLSGYVGSGRRPTGPFHSYFYNNTIFVREGFDAKFAVASTAAGVMIANNIFYIGGRSLRVAGDQSRADRVTVASVERGVMSHNLFLRADNWPAGLGLADEHALFGDPLFANPGGSREVDYTPRASELVKNRGVRIAALPGDEIGLALGLAVATDILGRPIVGAPDLGAIELP